MAFAADLDVLKVKFTHSNTVRDKKPYTIYEIEVRSSSTITWVIYKRYSSFHQLHVELNKFPHLVAANLPQLPPKRLTRSLAVEFVEKRKNELQDYLRALLETPGLVHTPTMLAFLEVPDSVKPMLAAAQHYQQQSGGMGMMGSNQSQGGMGDVGSNGLYLDGPGGVGSSGHSASKSSFLSSKSPDERRVLELLNLLRFHPNKVAGLKSFEEWFFENRPRLSGEYVRMLLQGKPGVGGSGGGGAGGMDSSSDAPGGLIQTIGDLSYSHVASRAALYLLVRLLDVEKNKDANMFLEAFTGLDVQVLKKMQINQHIISERGNRIGAFKLIAILRAAPMPPSSSSSSSNPSGPGGAPTSPMSSSSSNQMNTRELQLESIVNDSWALREFYKWAERKNECSGQIVPFNHYGGFAHGGSGGGVGGAGVGRGIGAAGGMGGGSVGGGGIGGVAGGGGGGADDSNTLKPLDLTSPAATGAATSSTGGASGSGGTAPATPTNANKNAATGAPSSATASASASDENGSGSSSVDLTQMRFLRARISEIFQELRRVLEEPEKFVSGTDGNPHSPAVSNLALGRGSDAGAVAAAPAPWRLVPLVPQFDGVGGSGGVGGMDAVMNFDEDISLMYRKHVKPDMVCVKMQCILPYTMEEVAPYLADLRRRKEWDLKYHKGKCLEVRQTQEYAPAPAAPVPVPAPSSPSSQQQQQLQPPPHPHSPPLLSLQYPEIQADIVHMTFKSFSSPYKYRDLVLLRCFAQVDRTRGEFEAQGFKQRQQVAGGFGSMSHSHSNPTSPLAHHQHMDDSDGPAGLNTSGSSSASSGGGNGGGSSRDHVEDPIYAEGVFADGGMIFGCRSVLHSSGPEFKDNVRAVLGATGYVLLPLRDQGVLVHALSNSPVGPVPAHVTSEPGRSCSLTFISEMDRESVLIVSPDLLGETNELRHTFANLKACLARDLGVRTLQPSRHTAHLRALSGRPDAGREAGASSVGSGGVSGGYTHGHTRAPSVLATQQPPTPITYGHRGNVSDSDDPPSRNGSVVYMGGRSAPNLQPSPQMRGSVGPLPVIPEKR